MITNKKLREELVPIDRHRARLNAIQFSPHLTIAPDFMQDIGGHEKRLRTAQHRSDKINEELVKKIKYNSNWSGEEISILLSNGFSLFIGDDFLLRCKYAASFRTDTELTESVKGDRWDKRIVYNGDMPDSIIAKVVTIDNLRYHTHYRTYTGSLGTEELFKGLEYLVVSTAPLPVGKTFIKVDPFLLAFRRKENNRPMIEVSESGEIKEIRQQVGEYGFLIVGMWDMNNEVFSGQSPSGIEE